MRSPAAVLLAIALAVAVTVLAFVGFGHSANPKSGTTGTGAEHGHSDLPILGENEPVLGVDLYAPNNYSAAEVKAYGERTLGYIKNKLKADAVGIVWNFYAPSRTSNTVQETNRTLLASNVAILTRIATRYHLQVQYRPLIFVPTAQNKWEGKIAPSFQPSWFNNYYRAELPYLKIAQQLGVREFVAGTELELLNNSVVLWKQFFDRVSRVYHGTISYGAWDGNYFGSDPGWPLRKAQPAILPVKYVGMDMYWPLYIPPAATSAQVTSAWEDLFGRVSPALLRRTAIDEMGIQARSGAYAAPQKLGQPGRASERVQANWFTAACNTVHHFHMRGVFFFKVDLADHPYSPAPSLSTFEGREGAAAIKECARILH